MTKMVSKTLKASMKRSMATMMMTGEMMGRMMVQNTFQGEAPSTRAASRKLVGIPLIDESTSTATKGMYSQASTKATVYRAIFGSPSHRMGFTPTNESR